MLDVARGTGFYPRKFVRRGATKGIGIDSAHEMVALRSASSNGNRWASTTTGMTPQTYLRSAASKVVTGGLTARLHAGQASHWNT